MKRQDPLEGCTGFDWDDGNVDKNWDLHRVAFWEAEEVFFNEPLVVRADLPHSNVEGRFAALGQTDAGRLLFLSFTVRRSLIRIISARDMTRREARTYEHTKA
ncbi:MAG: BrnT family toxin [Acidobacteria bacterium]|nr:BrnT family toxin [Acidobacteriota bacterium]